MKTIFRKFADRQIDLKSYLGAVSTNTLCKKRKKVNEDVEELRSIIKEKDAYISVLHERDELNKKIKELEQQVKKYEK